jgi:hypothetical protein
MAVGVMSPFMEPGESEFSHGKGLMASAAQRGQYTDPIDPLGPWEPSVYEQGKAIQRTDPAYNSNAAYDAAPGTVDNTTETNWVRE